MRHRRYLPILAAFVSALLLHGDARFRDGEVGICAVLAAAALSALTPKRWKAWAGEPG